MRTTLDINDDLLAAAKAHAARAKLSLTAVIENSLRRALADQHGGGPTKHGRTELPVINVGGGVRRGIDTASNRSLSDAMDDDAATGHSDTGSQRG